MTLPTRICLPFMVADIPDPGSRDFSLPQGATELAGFVVHQGGEIYAYRNQCPHTGVALNWQE
ncbi:MAG: Rieske 2Fe-2S domain-containing protein, partial [Gammaproteobacteria bacterium]